MNQVGCKVWFKCCNLAIAWATVLAPAVAVIDVREDLSVGREQDDLPARTAAENQQLYLQYKK